MAGNDTLSLCSDPKYVFQSFDNLAHCYATYEDTKGANFTHVVETCLTDYCENPYPDLGGCGNWNGGDIGAFAVYTQGNQSFWNNATCVGVSEGVNSDIGGPGVSHSNPPHANIRPRVLNIHQQVFASYLMQLGMVFYFWILLRSFRLFSIINAFFNRRKPRRETFSTTKTKGTVIPRIRHYIAQNDRILKVILVEFQEAQCFFMIASQAAILLAKKSNTIFASTTIRSLWANNGVAGIVSSAGVFPVVMGMWCLQKMHMMEPWIFVLSVASIIVSEFSLYWTHETPSLDQLVPIHYDGWPKSCGGHAPPLIYCLDEVELTDERIPLAFFWHVLNPYCMIMFGLVVILWLQRHIVKIPRVNEICERALVHLGLGSFSSKDSTTARFDWRRWLRRLPSLLTFAVESLFLVAFLFEGVCFGLLEKIGLIDFNDWGFGQIVALTIWFPVVSKYAYLMICEFSTGFDVLVLISDCFNSWHRVLLAFSHA